MEPELIPVDYQYVRRWQVSAARDGVCVKPTAKTTLWFRDAEHRGFCGLIEFAPGRWRIKGVYVQPECRGKGFGTWMTEALIRLALENLRAPVLEVIALNQKFYEARKFERLSPWPGGCWRLVYKP